jgi:asparaginyl-tRNA synthetase
MSVKELASKLMGAAIGEGETSTGNECYVDPQAGVDEPSADGSKERPYKSLAYAYIQNAEGPARKYLTRAEPTAEGSKEPEWKEPAKSAVKKADSALSAYKKKMEKQRAAEKAERERREKALEEAKSVVLKEDPSLPKPQRITIGNKDIELGDGEKKGPRVKVCGRIHRIREQKFATFITLVDGYGQLQCILEAGPLTKCYDALLFTQGTSLAMYGELKKVMEGKEAPDNRELVSIALRQRQGYI